MGINKIIHEPARMQIMSTLYVVKSADSLFLLNQTGLTWGNLASHLKKLEEAKYILVKKEFKGRKPHTMISLTMKGRTAFDKYVKEMKGVLSKF